MGNVDQLIYNMNTLQTQVLKDLVRFFEDVGKKQKLFFNERDLQVNLACFLKEKGYNVELEYKVSIAFLIEKLGLKDKQDQWKKQIFPWNEKELAIDIVVRKGNDWLPIELKYKTKSVTLSVHERFGEEYKKECEIIKNQSAQDLGRYGFWKDVRRLEITSAAFKNVVGGIAVFYTNDKNYVECPKSNSGKLAQYRDFAMNVNERKKGEMAWRHNEDDGKFENGEKGKEYPNFSISNSYQFEYEELDVGYCWILSVPKTESL